MIKQLDVLQRESVSRAVVEPELHVLNGVVLQAVSDLSSTDIVRAVDALCFWLSDESYFWLDAIGVKPDPDPERVLLQAIYGAAYGKTKKSKFSRVDV